MVGDCGLTGLKCNDPSLCKVNFAAECDLHTIVDRFLKTGQLPAGRSPINVDSDMLPEDIFDLQQRVIDARSKFDSLPLEVRNQFNNDPETFYNAVLTGSVVVRPSVPPASPEPSTVGSEPSTATSEPPKEG